MEINGESYISAKYTKEDYQKLEISVLSRDPYKWSKAIKIFEDRIEGRYLKTIKALMENEDYLRDGFLIMAINCLLIDTLLQFKVDEEIVKHTSNTQLYTGFLYTEFPEVFIKESTAKLFYKDIRCGILHSAQTMRKSKLTHKKDYIIESFKINNRGPEYIAVDVENFTKLLISYFEKYIEDLKMDNKKLRNNFIVKMNAICKL